MSARTLRYALLAIVFTTGAAVLIIEVTATRLLAPHFGTTIYMLSSVIGVILAALSAGYWAGGKLSDRAPTLHTFFLIIMASGMSVLILQLAAVYFLPSVSPRLSLITGPPLVAAALYVTPSLLLGMLSPYAIKLLHLSQPQQGVGSVSGLVFFWSTLGSIAGTFLAGFYLIPNVGLNEIMAGTGLYLAALGVVGPLLLQHAPLALPEMLLLLAAVAAVWGSSRSAPSKNVVFATDGVYQSILIYDAPFNGRPARHLRQDRNPSGAVYLDTGEATAELWDYYALYRLFKADKDIKRALVLGGGAYLIPRAMVQALPAVQIETVEIEPSLFSLARQYFGLPDTPRHRAVADDGRRFLQEASGPYDLIFSDAYHSFYSVPAHLATVEFFALVKEKLADEGVFIANIIGGLTPDAPSFALSELRTFQAVFPNSYFFALESPLQSDPQNIIFVGYKGTARVDMAGLNQTAGSDPLLRNLPAQQIDPRRLNLPAHVLLTDNYSPTDFLAAQVTKQLNAQPRHK